MDTTFEGDRKTIAYYERALHIAREARAAAGSEAEQTEARHGEGLALGHLANACSALGEMRKAIEHYEEGLSIAREIRAASRSKAEWMDARRAEGAHLCNLGNAYSDLGEMGKAIAYYQEALVIAREVGAASQSEAGRADARRDEGANLGNLGTAYNALEKMGKAIGYYEEALAIARETGDRRNEGIWLADLGTAYSDLGKAEQAIECYEEALRIAREMRAAAGSDRERTTARRGEGNRLDSLGNVYSALGEVEKAIGYYEEALAIAHETGDRSAEANHSWNLGDELQETDPGRAAELMQVCVDYERELGHPDAETDAARVEALRRRAAVSQQPSSHPWWQFWRR